MQTELFVPTAQDFAVMAAGYLRLANELRLADTADRQLTAALIDHYLNRYHQAHAASLELRQAQP